MYGDAICQAGPFVDVIVAIGLIYLIVSAFKKKS